MNTIVVFGSGGHAKVIVDALQSSNPNTSLAIVDNAPQQWNKSIFGVPVQGDDNTLPLLVSQGATRFIVGVGSVKQTDLRQRLFEKGLAAGLQPHSVVHPSAFCSRRASYEAGAQLLAGCIVNATALVQKNAVINSGAIIEHDCIVGPHAHVATGAKLCGDVIVGARAHIGAGAVIIQGKKIGADAVVGAGAVVVTDVPPGTVVVGIPARILRSAAA